jgi:hypothetical protein
LGWDLKTQGLSLGLYGLAAKCPNLVGAGICAVAAQLNLPVMKSFHHDIFNSADESALPNPSKLGLGCQTCIQNPTRRVPAQEALLMPARPK